MLELTFRCSLYALFSRHDRFVVRFVVYTCFFFFVFFFFFFACATLARRPLSFFIYRFCNCKRHVPILPTHLEMWGLVSRLNTRACYLFLVLDGLGHICCTSSRAGYIYYRYKSLGHAKTRLLCIDPTSLDDITTSTHHHANKS